MRHTIGLLVAYKLPTFPRDGPVFLGPHHLGAQASTMMDMAMLIGENRPDVHGKNFPAGVQQGSVVIEGAKGEAQWMTLVVSSGVYNPLRGTCTVNCITCYGYSGFCVVANFFAVPCI